MIECRSLGPLIVTVDGGDPAPELMWRKHIGLFLYLAHSHDLRRSRDDMIGALWADKPDAAARQSLRQAVHVIRRHAGADYVLVDAHEVRLLASGFTLDTMQLDRLEQAGDLRRAAELIRGDFAEGFAVPHATEFEDWLDRERVKWRARSVRILLTVAEDLERDGNPSGAVDYALRALDRDPGSDAAAASVMKCLALTGNRTGALEVFDRLTRHLASLDAHPNADVRDLAERLRRGDESGSTVTPRLREGSGAGSVRLVGRRREMHQILELWDGCRQTPRCGIVILEGDPGVGKTRLAREAMERMRVDGAATASARAISAQCRAAWAGVAALAASDLLAAPGAAGADSVALTRLRTLAAAVTRRFPAIQGHDDELDPAIALQSVVAAVSDEQPLVMLVDDAHWLDQESLRALLRLIRDLSSQPVILWLNHTTAHRRTEIEELRGWVGREVEGVATRLTFFSEPELRELTDAIMPPMPEAQRDRLVRRIRVDSAGVPLLAVALLQAVAAGLDLTKATQWPQPFRTLDQTLPSDLPDSIVGAIRIRFRRTSRDGQAVLRVLAIVSDRVPVIVLRRIIPLDSAQLERALDELEWDGWLDADARGYTFSGRIVRDVVSRDLVTAGQRERILAAAAEV